MPLVLASLGTTFADWGRPEDADAVYAELMGRTRRCYVQPSVLAMAAAAEGIEEKAVQHTREALDIRDPGSLMVFSKKLFYGARLWAYPRFQEIVASMEM